MSWFSVRTEPTRLTGVTCVSEDTGRGVVRVTGDGSVEIKLWGRFDQDYAIELAEEIIQVAMSVNRAAV